MANIKSRVSSEIKLENRKTLKRSATIERIVWSGVKDKRPRYWLTVKNKYSENTLPAVTREDLIAMLTEIDRLDAQAID